VLFSRTERPQPRREAVVLLHLDTVVLHQVGRFFDVADTFEAVLPGFVSHERRELPAVPADRRRHVLHHGDAIAPGAAAPRRIGGARGGDGFADLIAAGALERSQQDAGVGWA